MAKKVTPKEISAWMNLDIYNRFLDLTIDEIINELEHRIFFLLDLSSKENPDENFKKFQAEFLEDIKSGAILSSDLSKRPISSSFDDDVEDEEISDLLFRIHGRTIMSKDHDQHPQEEELAKGEALSPFTLADLVSYHRHFRLTKHIDEIDNIPVVNAGRIFSSVNAVEDGSEYFYDEIVVNVNLSSFTDDELLSEFKELLKQWRKQLGINEPEQYKQRVGISTIKKIYSYRVFPFLDLMLWESVNQRKISNELIARVLYPLDGDEVVGGQQIKDSVRPFVEKIVFESTLQQLKFYTMKNDYLRTMRLSDVMKIAE